MLGSQQVVGTRVDDDAVVVRADQQDRGPRHGLLVPENRSEIDARGGEVGQGGTGVAPDAREQGHPRAEAAGGERLIRALPASGLETPARADRLALARQALEPVAEVEVDGTDDKHFPTARRAAIRPALWWGMR